MTTTTITAPTESLPESQARCSPIPTRTMGPSGPLRMFSEHSFPGSTLYETPSLTGFIGHFVCDACTEATDGVYRVEARWLCGACRSNALGRGPKKRKGQYPDAPPQDGDQRTIQRFAARHKLKLRTDEDSTRCIEGKFGQIYEHSPETLAVQYGADTSTWSRRRRAGEDAGMTCWQDGDLEGVLHFNPEDRGQVKVAISIAGVRRKRKVLPLSPAQQQALAIGRSANRPRSPS